MVSAATMRNDLVMRTEALRARLARAMQRSVLREWLDVELTMPQWKVLMTLHAGQPATVGELAKALGVSLPTASGILDRLEAHGLVARAGDTRDRRVVRVELTADGADLAGRLVRTGQRRFQEILAPLDESEIDTVARAFEILCRSAERSGSAALDGEATCTIRREA